MRRLARLKAAMAEPALDSTPQEPDDGALIAVLLFAAAALVASSVQYLADDPPKDNVPSGQMPTLEEYLQANLPERSGPRDRPPGNNGGRAPPPGSRRNPEDLHGLELRPVSSPGELWEAYAFATGQIMNDGRGTPFLAVEGVPPMEAARNYVTRLALQAAAFPRVYREWKTLEGCAVEEVSLGPEATALRPVGATAPPQQQDRWREPGSKAEADADRELVLACGEWVEEYGLSLMARQGAGPPVGCATLRVKRLPEDCHVEYDCDEGAASIVRTVDRKSALDAAGLEGVAYIDYIAVSRQWRGIGLAEKLMDFVEKNARAWGLRLVGLHVHRGNWSALKFYKKQGFEISSDWLGWGESYFLLLKPL